MHKTNLQFIKLNKNKYEESNGLNISLCTMTLEECENKS